MTTYVDVPILVYRSILVISRHYFCIFTIHRWKDWFVLFYYFILKFLIILFYTFKVSILICCNLQLKLMCFFTVFIFHIIFSVCCSHQEELMLALFAVVDRNSAFFVRVLFELFLLLFRNIFSTVFTVTVLLTF